MYPTLAPGAPSINKHLEDFDGNQVEGSPVDPLNETELDMLDSGYNFIKVKDTDSSSLLLASATTRVSTTKLYIKKFLIVNDLWIFIQLKSVFVTNGKPTSFV